MELEWDEHKRHRNLAKHGVDFRDAVRVFLDPHLLWGFDDRHSDHEDRWWNLGITVGAVLLVVTTERGTVQRIISARKATQDERAAYYENLTR